MTLFDDLPLIISASIAGASCAELIRMKFYGRQAPARWIIVEDRGNLGAKPIKSFRTRRSASAALRKNGEGRRVQPYEEWIADQVALMLAEEFWEDTPTDSSEDSYVIPPLLRMSTPTGPVNVRPGTHTRPSRTW